MWGIHEGKFSKWHEVHNRTESYVVGRQIEISQRHWIIVIIVTESIFVNEFITKCYIILITDKNFVVGKMILSESRLFLLQEDTHAAGTRRFSEADSSVNFNNCKC
jgi:hypothetical protein